MCQRTEHRFKIEHSGGKSGIDTPPPTLKNGSLNKHNSMHGKGSDKYSHIVVLLWCCRKHPLSILFCSRRVDNLSARSSLINHVLGGSVATPLALVFEVSGVYEGSTYI